MLSLLRIGRKTSLFLGLLLGLGSAGTAPAQEPSSPNPEQNKPASSAPPPPRLTALGMLPRIDWAPHHRKTNGVDYALAGIGAVGSVVARVIGPRDGGPEGGVWIDEDVRNGLRAPTFSGRLLAEDISDVLLGVTSSYGLMGDPLVNAAWLRDSPEVGKELFWINAEVMGLTLGIQQTTANWVGRERPYGRTCGTAELDERTHHCEGNDRYRSYFSGHTSVPFSIATATCINHIYLPLSGGHAWIPCSLGFLAAGASGTLRIVSDNHYATDVMTGALVGTTVGLTVPLLHYATGRHVPRARLGGAEMMMLPLTFSPSGRPAAGLSLLGVLR